MNSEHRWFVKNWARDEFYDNSNCREKCFSRFPSHVSFFLLNFSLQSAEQLCFHPAIQQWQQQLCEKVKRVVCRWMKMLFLISEIKLLFDSSQECVVIERKWIFKMMDLTHNPFAFPSAEFMIYSLLSLVSFAPFYIGCD